jgi:hypothetical protein
MMGQGFQAWSSLTTPATSAMNQAFQGLDSSLHQIERSHALRRQEFATSQDGGKTSSHLFYLCSLMLI